MLELDGLVKLFGSVIAVNGIDLDVRDEEFLVILGPAGAGKSTTLRLIAGLTQPTSGDIRLGGRSLTDVPPERRNISMVFENYALYSHRTVFQNLSFPLEARAMGRQEIKRRVEAMASTLLIDQLLERRPGALSGGQRQRVALGRGLIREAAVYLLDEPLSHLDARIRQDVRVQLKAMSRDLHSVVIHVTQDYREAMSLADRIAVLDGGSIQQVGTPDEIYAKPANEFVATFVGDPPMSLIDASFVSRNGGLTLNVAGTEVVFPADDLAHIAAQTSPDATVRVAARATDIAVSRFKTGACPIPSRVYVSESHGYRSIVTTKLGEYRVRVAAPSGDTWAVDDPVWLGLGMHNLHVFVNGRAVHHPTRVLAQVTSEPALTGAAAGS